MALDEKSDYCRWKEKLLNERARLFLLARNSNMNQNIFLPQNRIPVWMISYLK